MVNDRRALTRANNAHLIEHENKHGVTRQEHLPAELTASSINVSFPDDF